MIMDFTLCSCLQEEDGYTGLHHAAKLGNLEIVNMLLETGQVDVNAQVKRRLSIINVSLCIISVLLEANSDSCCRFVSGQRWLDADHLVCRAQTRRGDKSAAEQRS